MAKASTTLKVGDKAPDFVRYTPDGAEWQLSAHVPAILTFDRGTF